jgi:hypothetical protein
VADRHIEAIPGRWVTYTYRTSDENELEVCTARNPRHLSDEERLCWGTAYDYGPRPHPVAISMIHPKCPARGPIAPEGHVQIEFLLTEAVADKLVIRLTRGLQMWRGEMTPDEAIAAIRDDDDKAKAVRDAREESDD